MCFKVFKKESYNALSAASRIISVFSPLPAFSGVRINAKEDYLILTGGDSDVSVQTKLTESEGYVLEICDMGSVVIEAEYTLEITRRIDAGRIEFEMIGGSLTRASGNTAEFRINGMRANKYPVIDSSKLKRCFALEGETLKKAILQADLATSDRETCPALTDVNFHCEGNTLYCATTDSYHLAKKTIDISESLNLNIITPAKSLSEVVKTLGGEGEVEIAANDKRAQSIVRDIIVQMRLTDGVYPEASRLIPL